MDVYHELVNYAEKLIEVSDNDKHKNKKKDNKYFFISLLNGNGPFKVEYNGNGHNYQAVIDAIHKYYDLKKDESIKTDYEDALKFFASHSIVTRVIQQTYDFITYEMKKEKNGTGTMEVDSKEILEILSNTIQENYDKLRKESFNFDNWIKDKNRNLETNYDSRIL